MFSQMDSKVQNIVSEILNDVNCQCNQSNTECELLDREAIVRVIEELETVLFPAHFSSKKAIGNFALRYELKRLHQLPLLPWQSSQYLLHLGIISR